MIITILTIFYILLLIVAFRTFFFNEGLSDENLEKNFFLMVILMLSTVLYIAVSPFIIKNFNKANAIKSQIILMKPLEKFREDIAINEKELAKVERLIEKAFDKNNPNVSVRMENGVKIYSFLGSSDLGSAEAGNAEKQKLLMNYIEKQNKIADQLIYIKKLAYGDEYYKLQQEYATFANSIFDGWVIRLFSISENYKPVNNQIYAPNE